MCVCCGECCLVLLFYACMRLMVSARAGHNKYHERFRYLLAVNANYTNIDGVPICPILSCCYFLLTFSAFSPAKTTNQLSSEPAKRPIYDVIAENGQYLCCSWILAYEIGARYIETEIVSGRCHHATSASRRSKTPSGASAGHSLKVGLEPPEHSALECWGRWGASQLNATPILTSRLIITRLSPNNSSSPSLVVHCVSGHLKLFFLTGA